MLQEQLSPFRRSLSRRRSFKDGFGDRDDRGWTPLHVSARKGNLEEVIFSSPLLVEFIVQTSEF